MMFLKDARINQMRLTGGWQNRWLPCSVGSANFLFDCWDLHDAVQLAEIQSQGSYEPSVTRFLLTALERGDKFVNVGANNGYFAILGSICTGTEGSVWAFEPSESAYTRLVRNLGLNESRNVIPVRKGAWSRSGKLVFNISGMSDAWNSAYDLVRPKKRVSVEVVALDDVLPIAEYKLMLIDAEGAEPDILKGASRTIDLTKYVVLEWARFNFPTRELHRRLEFYKSIGEVYVLGHQHPSGSLRILGPVSTPSEIPTLSNLLLVPST